MPQEPAEGRSPTRAFVISHTHWDREWYHTFHEFRVHLVSTVGMVLDALDAGGAFKHFLLDGQTVILEDYLEVAPFERERLSRHVAEGGLGIGPWYVLPDEFLVSGEATVRNLLLGHAVGRGIGPVQKVGYMPDSFGHIAQMPQILRGADIDSFVYTRGNGDELEELGSEYIWQAPDGSEVLAINQYRGYSNAAALGHAEFWEAHTRRNIDRDLAVERIRSLFETAAESSNVSVRLLMNGSDHLPPQRDLGYVLDALREAFPDTEFVHARLEDFLEAVRSESPELGVFRGELLGGRNHHILSGVWSARMPLKQANDRAESLLADVLEPLATYAWFQLGRDYPKGQIDHAWRLLLLNHPHDSICGCSIDEVHREMETRSTGVSDAAERLIRDTLVEQAPTFATSESGDRDITICVANTLTRPRDALVDRLIVFVPPAPDTENLVLLDERGREITFEIADETYVERFWGIDYRTMIDSARQRDLFESYIEAFGEGVRRERGNPGLTDCFLRIRFMARDLPPVGHAVYRLAERARLDEAEARPNRGTSQPRESPLEDPGAGSGGAHAEARGNTLENDMLRISMHEDGTFDLTDKRSGSDYRGLSLLEDREDAGDEYDYSPAEHSTLIRSAGIPGELRIVDAGRLRAGLEARFDLELPEGLEGSRSRRSDARVSCPVALTVWLSAGSPIVDVKLEFTNRARDHRLRALFPTGIATDDIVSDGQFYVNERPVRRREHPDWVQPPPETVPQMDFSLVEDGGRGLALLVRGLPEVAALADEAGGTVLALTLLRSVGWLSRDDFPTRRYQNAGPTLWTPEAQCLGPHVFRYALLPYGGDFLSAGVKWLARCWRTPVPSVQGVWDGHTPGRAGLVRSHSSSTSVSAVKRHETRNSLVVRVYNLSAERVWETLSFGRPISAAWRVNLLEERLSELEPDQDAVSLELRPHEIGTIEVAFRGA